MDWTIKDFAHANHNPIIVVTDQAGKDQSGNDHTGTAPIYIDAEVGKPVTLDATKSSDPDAGQKLHYNWFHYFEAGGTGTNLSEVTITGDWHCQSHRHGDCRLPRTVVAGLHQMHRQRNRTHHSRCHRRRLAAADLVSANRSHRSSSVRPMTL